MPDATTDPLPLQEMPPVAIPEAAAIQPAAEVPKPLEENRPAEKELLQLEVSAVQRSETLSDNLPSVLVQPANAGAPDNLPVPDRAAVPMGLTQFRAAVETVEDGQSLTSFAQGVAARVIANSAPPSE